MYKNEFHHKTMHRDNAMQSYKTKLGIVSACALLGLSSITYAGGSADFTLDGAQISTSSVNINASQQYSLKYTGGSNGCTNVDWYFKKQGQPQWKLFDSSRTATLAEIYRSGSHQLKMSTSGYDGRYFFNLLGCNHQGQNNVRTVNLDIATPGYTQTENPIMLVPGVLAWDDIFGMEYFYRIGDEIKKDSDQAVKDVSLAAWQNTEDRGADLADKILDFLIIQDDNFLDPNSSMKVNLIAHSHGTTTSRMAINILSKAFAEVPNKKVASLTTVAGPHYGTPSADGAIWAIENWEEYGDILGTYVVDGLIGNLAGTLAAILSGHASDYPQQDIISVLKDFTQKGMARFNSCYPSAGVPTGGKYFIEAPLADNNTPFVNFPEIINGKVTFNDCREYGINDNTGKFEVTKNFSSGPVSLDLASTPDEAFGANTLAGGIYGNGLGVLRNGTEDDAIRYFSFTGSAHWNTQFGLNIFAGDNPAELSDIFLLLMSSLFSIPGERTDKNHLWTWIGDTGIDLLNGDPVARDKGYTKASDSFIPVDSTVFGQYVGTHKGWNHVDEMNALFGLVGEGADNPVEVYREHLNRLQLSGL